MKQSVLAERLRVRPGAGSVVITYMVFAALWIFLSDGLLMALMDDPALLGRLSVLKGVLFVVTTGGLLYLLLKSRRGSGLSPETLADGPGLLPRSLRAVAFIPLFLGVPLIGIGVITLQRPLQEKEVYADLRGVADLKAAQIEHWLKEREGDARVLAEDAGFAEHVGDLLRQPSYARSAGLVKSRLAAVMAFPDYRGLLLIDKDGTVRLPVGDSSGDLRFDPQLLSLALATGAIQRGPLAEQNGGEANLDVVVPIMAKGRGTAQPLAAVLLRIDPQRFLFPYVSAWPSARSSGESLLVRRDGDSVRFLTPLRHGEALASNLTKPIDDPGLPAAAALRHGGRSTFDGKDYRGVRVLAAYGPVAGTDWHIVVKLDRSEVMAPVNRMGVWVSTIALFAALAVAAAMVLVWRQQRRSDAMAMQAQTAFLSEQSNQRYRALAHAAQDAIIALDADGDIVGWNSAAERIFGYTESEAMGQPGSMLLPASVQQVPIGALLRQLAQRNREGPTHDTEWSARRKDGSPFPIELSLGQWKGPEGVYYIAIVRDVSQRRQSEQALAASARQFRKIIELSPVPHLLSDEQWRTTYVNPAFIVAFGYRREDLPDLDAFWEKALPVDEERLRVTQAWLACVDRSHGRTESAGSLQTRISCQDGSERTVTLDAVRLGDAGEAIFLTILLDITALTNAAQRLQAVFEASSDGIHVLDRSGNVVQFNPSFASMLGYSSEEAAQLNVADWEAAIAPGEVVQVLQRLMEVPSSFETRHRRKDGQVFDVEVRTARLVLEGRRYLYASSRDITERKVAEVTLRLNDERLRLMTESIRGYAIVMLDPQGQILVWNAGAERVSGYTQAEILGKSYSVFFEEAEIRAGKPQALLETAVEAGRAEEQGWRVRKDGSRFFADTVISAMQDASVQLVGFVAVMRDVTERQEAERKLAITKERLQVAASAGIIGIWEWDVVQDRLVWDEVMCRLYGLKEAGISGTLAVWTAAMHPEDRAATEESIQAALRGECEFAAEFRILWPDGSVRHLKAAAHTTFGEAGEAIRMVGVNYDLTDHKAAEQALSDARQIAEAASRAKSEFLANMSHEIRTPMNAVMGLAQLLQDTDLNPRQRDYLAKMISASHSLLGVLNDILDYSKIEAGKLALEAVDFSIEEILDGTASLFSHAAEEKGLELIFDVAQDVPEVLVGDVLRLKQVINNLVGNAVKFTQSGHVRFTVGCHEIGGEDVLLEAMVEDTGVGLTQEEQERLFQPFEQADSSTTRKFGGTGLGLTIARRLVELMGGALGVISQLGQGSTFTFTARAKRSSHCPQGRNAANLRGMRTLVVDDHAVSREIMRRVLDTWSFDVDTAPSGDEGLEKALAAYDSGRPYELVLVDWRMPGTDGVGLAKRLREAETRCCDGHRQAIVIMVTAFGRTLAQEAAGDGDLDGFLDKPVVPSQLFDLVSNLQGARPRGNFPRRSAEMRQGRERLRPIIGARILLVEDNLTNQMIAREMLENCGLEVVVANDGEEAVEKASAAEFDAILMDLQMPRMDGHEATRRIRCLPDRQATPVIAMTAAALPSDREASQASGMNDFIAKPIDIADLTSVLLRWISPRETAVRGDSRTGNAPRIPPSEGGAKRFSLPGLNLDEAASRLGGNWNLLGRALRRFGSDFAGSAAEIARLAADGHWKDAERLAHTVKGMSLSIGSQELFETARQLEDELAGEQCASLDRFGAALAATLAAIARLPAPSDRDSARCDPSRMEAVLAEILDCLKRSGFVSPETLDELGALEPDTPGHALSKKLREQIERFDYPAAIVSLQDLAQLLQLEWEG